MIEGLHPANPATARRMARFAAVCALASAVTTFLLWWLGQQVPPPGSPEEAVALAHNPAYMGRLWDNFIHVFLAIAGYGAAATLLARRQPALGWSGLVALLFWAFTEALGVAISIWALNGDWRGGWAAADAAQRASIEAAMLTFQGIWNGMFFVILTLFALGSLLLGLAMVSATRGLGRIVGGLMLTAVPLTAIILLDGYFGFALGGLITWTYPVLQPVSRALMGWWIWREAGAAWPALHDLKD